MLKVGKIKKLVMKYFLRKNFEKNDTPGFSISSVGFGSIGFQARTFYAPELLFSDLENNVEEEFGQKGVEKLYAAGKNYGWEYAGMAGFPNVIEDKEKDLRNAFSTMADYVELIQTSKLEYEFDFDNVLYTATYDEPLILQQNDKGYIFYLGTAAGFLAYVMQEKNVESSKAEKLSETRYKIETGKPESLEKDPLTKFSDLKEVFHSRNYGIHNSVRKIDGESLKDLLETEDCYQKQSKFYLKDQRHINFEAGMLHQLEKQLGELKSKQVLFQTGYENGKKISLESDEEVISYLTGTGWGEVKIEGEMTINYFPWHPVATETELNLFRGFVSGLMSAYGDEVKFEETEIKEEKGNLKIVFS